MNEEKIKKIVGNLDYRKGLSCINNVEYYNKFKHEDLKIYEYYVSSETRRYTKYFVNIITKEGNVLDSSCSCPQYDLTGSCKHLGAALIKHQNEIFKTEKEQSLELSKNIINLFYKDKQNNKGIRKQVSIEVILMPSVYNCSVKIDLKIGIDRKYSLNNKLYSFLCAYNNEEELEFGKSFKYDPSTMYLTEEDIEIIEFLDNMNDNNYYFDSKNLSLQGKNLNHFMSLLKNKKYTIMGYGIFNGFIKGNPYQIKLEKNTNYELTVDTTNIEPLGDSNYVIANKTIYLVSNNIKKIINTMKTNGLETLEFLEEDIDRKSVV